MILLGGIACLYTLREEPIGDPLLTILKKLKHRGNQGTGIAILKQNKDIIIERYPDGVEDFEKRLNLQTLVGVIGIGNIRHATHGRPDTNNTQPLTDCVKKVYTVMDGVIADYDVWREEFEKKGHIFSSKNDAELIAHRLEESLQKSGFREALLDILKHFQGYFATAIISKEESDKLGLISKGPELFIGLSEDSKYLVASELEALVPLVREYYVLKENEIAIIDKRGIHFYNHKGEGIKKQSRKAPDKIEYRVPGGFNHFMLREIFEIPSAIRRALFTHQKTYLDLIARMIINADKIYLIGCGSSYYAAQVGSYLLRELADIPSEVIDATEFPFYALKNVKPGTVIIALSQSGTTTDVIRAVMKAKMFGASIIGIMNVLGSPLMFASNLYLPLGVGPEHAVPATKSFIGQLLAIYRVALKLAEIRDIVPKKEIDTIKENLYNLPIVLEKTIQGVNETVKRIAKEIMKTQSVLVASRGINYPIALEGALKLKEVAYIHAEGIEAGELRHGPRAILTEGFPVILIMPTEEDARADAYQLLSELSPIKIRSIIITNEKDATRAKRISRDVIATPDVQDALAPFVNVIPLQLLAYWIGVFKGNPIDSPRGLQKYVVLP